MNTLPKYVVSKTLTEGIWDPTTVLTGDPVRTVAALKSHPGRELQIHGSARLGDALLSAGLVDTLRLVVAPTVLRTGRRLLTGDGAASGLRLTHHEATPNGLLLLEYQTTGEAPRAEYEGVTALI
ncbi:dihydrofolate reductase family protein [Nonomuraea sp. MCN248]|uniref:Dihydrofolate reductase family protein n=1 Tax=Nonomuraea corallina TaxID=2989783 RepID=A0ABT4S6X7_9ACTN|nr:dihydrofolate reductase family protein [Nonomuraea corallina]MDA0632953.1 dihydrofolate reductase family protein [Nonomuraea corallina]